MKFSYLLLLVTLGLWLHGCGQQGPLYLPGKEPPNQTVPKNKDN